MKRIGIDARLIRQTGVGVYLRNLLFFLEKDIPPSWMVFVYLLKEDLHSVTFQNRQFVKREASYRWHSLAEQVFYPRRLYRDKLDLMHFTYFSYPISYRGKFISTIHDLTPLLFATGKASTKNKLVYQLKHFFLKIVLHSQMRNSRTIITPTKSVKKQLVQVFGKRYQRKIHPIYEGVNKELIGIRENAVLKKSMPKEFLLYIGNFYPHKNVERLISAFAKVKTSAKLVLVGPDDFFAKSMTQLINRLDQIHRVLLFKNPKLADLIFFYKNAIALINPTLSEGFGLPMIEAAYFGCPIVGSDIEVFDEVLGSSFIRFDPYDISDIAKKISHVLVRRPRFDGKRLVEKYSFEKMARETMALYQKALKM